MPIYLSRIYYQMYVVTALNCTALLYNIDPASHPVMYHHTDHQKDIITTAKPFKSIALSKPNQENKLAMVGFGLLLLH